MNLSSYRGRLTVSYPIIPTEVELHESIMTHPRTFLYTNASYFFFAGTGRNAKHGVGVEGLLPGRSHDHGTNETKE